MTISTFKLIDPNIYNLSAKLAKHFGYLNTEKRKRKSLDLQLDSCLSTRHIPYQKISDLVFICTIIYIFEIFLLTIRKDNFHLYITLHAIKLSCQFNQRKRGTACISFLKFASIVISLKFPSTEIFDHNNVIRIWKNKIKSTVIHAEINRRLRNK